MKNSYSSFFIAIAILSFHSLSSQTFTRKQFDYSKIEEKNYTDCDTATLMELELALQQIDNLQSKQSAITAQKVFDKNTTCPQVYEVYAWSLFRSGEWEKSIEIVESGIDKFGKNPDLIIKRAYMGIEMAELGVAQKNIDGNSVYVGKDKQLPYDEAQFIELNYKTALSDFEYLAGNYENMNREIMIVGYIYQQLKQYDKSNEYLNKLLEVEDYRMQALLTIADNHIEEKKFDEAQTILIGLEKQNPRSVTTQKKLYALYEIKGEKELMKQAEEKQYFYQVTPSFSDLAFNKENYDAIVYFADENSEKEKLNKLKKIIKEKDPNYSIEICLSILKMHTNHGNGLEEKATQELIKFGKAALPKTILLLENENVSTCTISNLADVLATVKDTSGWLPLVHYLPVMANMPFTLIPPNVPEKIMKFDKEKGARVLIEFNRMLIQNEVGDDNSGNPMAGLSGFGQYLFYMPLKELKKDKVISIAKEFNYTDDELKVLLKKIYD